MKTREAWDPNSSAFLSSGSAASGPKEGRFETAQALEKRLSLDASIMPYLLSYCACKRKNAALSGTVN